MLGGAGWRYQARGGATRIHLRTTRPHAIARLGMLATIGKPRVRTGDLWTGGVPGLRFCSRRRSSSCVLPRI